MIPFIELFVEIWNTFLKNKFSNDWKFGKQPKHLSMTKIICLKNKNEKRKQKRKRTWYAKLHTSAPSTSSLHCHQVMKAAKGEKEGKW